MTAADRAGCILLKFSGQSRCLPLMPAQLERLKVLQEGGKVLIGFGFGLLSLAQRCLGPLEISSARIELCQRLDEVLMLALGIAGLGQTDFKLCQCRGLLFQFGKFCPRAL